MPLFKQDTVGRRPATFVTKAVQGHGAKRPLDTRQQEQANQARHPARTGQRTHDIRTLSLCAK